MSNVTNSGTPLPPAATTDDRLPLPGEPGAPTGPQGAQGPQGAAPARQTGSPFAADSASRNQGPNTLSGTVGNATPYDADMGAIKQVFDQHGLAAPSESQLRNLDAASADSQPVRNLVDGVKSNVQNGTPLPNYSDYQAAHSTMADQMRQSQADYVSQFNQKTIDKMGQSGNDDRIASKIADPAALVMFVMLKAKTEITAEKKDDLNQIKKYSTINDLMNQYMNTELLPLQQQMQDKMNKVKGDKANKQTVEARNVQNVNLDNYATDEDGNPQLESDTGRDKNGAPGPETKKVTQTQLTSEIQQFQNQLQQVSSRMQREQTNYSGHDSQDSTLSNIITATNKTFADARSAILGNMK